MKTSSEKTTDEQQRIAETYKSRIQNAEKQLTKVRKKIVYVSVCRLILFVTAVINAIVFSAAGWGPLFLFAVAPFIGFMGLVKHHNQLFHEKDVLKKRIEINEQEIKGLNYDFAAFEGGEEYINPEHPYTFDLDVFGKQSLFQAMNRTSTPIGKEHLAQWLNAHLENKKDIEERQELVQELVPDITYRQEMRLAGLLFQGKSADKDVIKKWAESPCVFRKQKAIRALPYLAAITNISCMALAMADVLSINMATGMFFCFVLVSTCFTKRINQLQADYGKKLQILKIYAEQILLTEKKEMKSVIGRQLKQQLIANGESASAAVYELAKKMNALDQRNNVLISIILNGFGLWEVRQAMLIEKWKESHAHKLPQWLEVVGEMEAYCSVATFAYNHPGYAYPIICTEPFKLKANMMGHPLMPADTCVCNDICMEKRPFFMIVTGANMAGKSTYLRTVGINYVLACIGAPVWAEKMEVYPGKLMTSLRTSDSLNDNESYFFAELKRLKGIIDRLKMGEKLFIVLDEILKGTNSIDKQKGSLALIKQFMNMKTNGIIATHDLVLGSLIDYYPEGIENMCFEAEIKNNELTFSYKMKEGIAQNMNACFLMRKMGITGIED